MTPRFLLAFSALFSCLTSARAQSDDIAGSWAGHVGVDGRDVGIRLRIDSPSRARFTVPGFGWYDQVARVATAGDHHVIDLGVYGDRARIELRGRGDQRSGTFSGWGGDGVAQLTRTGPPRAAFLAEPARFEHAGRRFDGTLLLPRGAGPFPAIVWTHGSGRVTRDNPIYRSLAVWVTEHGIASLIYDKRPPEPGATMQVLGADAVAGVEMLQDHDRLIPECIGVGGLSQGGWVSPIAASLSDSVAFVVGLSAPGISPAEQNIFNQYNKVLNAGFTEANAQEGTRILRAVYAYLRTGDDADAVRAELDRASRLPWYRSAYELPIWRERGLPPAPWEHRDALDFDPAPIWRAIRVPVVCVWGGGDDVVPPVRSRERIEQWLREAGNTRRLLTVLPAVDHDLRLPDRAPWTMGAMPAGLDAVTRFVHSLIDEPEPRPATPRDTESIAFHEITVPAPFKWLEQRTETRETWIREQDQATQRAFGDDQLVDRIRARIMELEQHARAPVPRVAGGRWFVDGQLPGENDSNITVRDGRDGEPRVLVDPHDHLGSKDPVALGPPVPSPDGRYVLHAAASSSIPRSVRVVEVDSGRDLGQDAVSLYYWPWRICWMPDSSGFYYSNGGIVRAHRIGTRVARDPILFRDEYEPRRELTVHAAADGSALFVLAFPLGADGSKVYVQHQGDDEWHELMSFASSTFHYVGKAGNRVFLHTTLDAPNGRVIAVDLDDGAWEEVIPTQPEPVYDGNHPARPTVGMFGDRIAALYARESRLLLRVFDLDGQLRHELGHRRVGFMESGLVGRADEPVVRYDEQSTFDPGTAIEVDLHTGTKTVIGKAQVPFDPAEFRVERHTYASRDGTEVPIILAHRRGLVRDGTNPVVISNWASLGMLVRPLFLPALHSWIELGGIVAIPAVRGSGELGEAWTRAGVRAAKGNAIDDFVAAADWLAQAGYSRADRIAMLGASMGGATSAAVFVRSPFSFGAGLFQIPRIDLLNDRAAIPEYGDPRDEAEFAAMMEWLPLQNARPGWYPPSFVQVGSDDTVAYPWHGYKLVAALQHAQLGSAPAYLQVIHGAGHSQGRGVPRRAATLSVQYAFLARALGLVR